MRAPPAVTTTPFSGSNSWAASWIQVAPFGITLRMGRRDASLGTTPPPTRVQRAW